MNFSEIRGRARTALKGKWGVAILASFLASLLGGSNSGSFNVNFELEAEDIDYLKELGFERFFESVEQFIEQNWLQVLGVLGVLVFSGLIVSIASFLLGSIVSVGYQKFNLDIVDGFTPSIGTLFSYFRYWKAAILSNLLHTLYVFLWSLLCVIPGIIAGYNYAMVPFIVAENPNIEPSEALRRSKEMMYGHRWELFLLNLSFIGWSILCILTCGIGYIWLTPYVNTATAEFYREISGTRGSYQYNYI